MSTLDCPFAVGRWDVPLADKTDMSGPFGGEGAGGGDGQKA